MSFVTRFHISRLTDANATEYYALTNDRDDWTRDRRDAVEFSTFERAARRADRVGGEAFEFTRPATALEVLMLSRPIQIHLQAAE